MREQRAKTVEQEFDLTKLADYTIEIEVACIKSPLVGGKPLGSKVLD
jgi:hypothetical protein